MKKVIKRMFPICLAAIILCQTVYSSVEVARASGVEQMLYYTYWDLITSIYSVCGYESKTDVSVANNHGVTEHKLKSLKLHLSEPTETQ